MSFFKSTIINVCETELCIVSVTIKISWSYWKIIDNSIVLSLTGILLESSE